MVLVIPAVIFPDIKLPLRTEMLKRTLGVRDTVTNNLVKLFSSFTRVLGQM